MVLVLASFNTEQTEFLLEVDNHLHWEKQNPDKEFIPLPNNEGCACNECPHMRLNTIEKIIDVLSNLKNEITVDENIRVKALKPINRMLEIV